MPLLLIAALLIFVHGCTSRRLVAIDTPALPPVQPKAAKLMPGDQPDKAADFYVMKRAGEGVRDLPYERYEAARRHADRMPLASSRKGNRAEAIDLGGWEALGPGNQGGRTRHLIIHPDDSKIMYAGAATGGVWKTINGGENWNPISDTFPALGIGALSFDPANPDTIYAGTGFWFNTLSGTSVFGAAPRGGGIFRTGDGGASWEMLPGTDATQFRYINEIFVSHNDASHIYVATWTGIFRSLDSGQSWTQVVNRGRVNENGCQDMVMRTDQSTDYLFASCGTSVASNPVILRKTDAVGDGEDLALRIGRRDAPANGKGWRADGGLARSRHLVARHCVAIARQQHGIRKKHARPALLRLARRTVVEFRADRDAPELRRGLQREQVTARRVQIPAHMSRRMLRAK